MDHASAYGFADFLAQTDAVGRTVLVILCLMSISTWYLILARLAQTIATRWRADRFLAWYWSAPCVQVVSQEIATYRCDEPFSRLTFHAVAAANHHARIGGGMPSGSGERAEFLTRSIRIVIDDEAAKMESGFTLLASIGSTAPFVGLLGTVWGIYHALVNIGMMGQGSLDKIAGPVGEALIMTALGLVVAIPAVLAYNAFGHSHRLLLARLDSFAHSLYSLFTTGEHVAGIGAVGSTRRAPPASPAVI